MERTIFVAIEPTGLDFGKDKVIELVALESCSGHLTGRQFQAVLNPQCPIKHDAEIVHGYNNQALQGMPLFSDIAATFLDFIRDAILVVYNANLHVVVLNRELRSLNFPELRHHASSVIDARILAKTAHPEIRFTADLWKMFDCKGPVHVCSETWEFTYRLAQLFPGLTRAVNTQPPTQNSNRLTRNQLEAAVPVYEGDSGMKYIAVAEIPQPWHDQFLRYVCAGSNASNINLNACSHNIWWEWLTRSELYYPNLSPKELSEGSCKWNDLRLAIELGRKRGQMIRSGRCVRYRDDLSREIEFSASAAGFTTDMSRQRQAYIRGIEWALTQKIDA